MTIGVLYDAVLMKCETRAQQLGILLCSLFFVLVLAGLGYWMFSLADAARLTLPRFAELDDYGNYQSRRTRQNLYSFMIMWYGLTAIAAFLVSILSAMAVVNAIRVITGTGIKDSGDW